MIEALGTIARSGTKAFLETIQDSKDKKQNDMNLIGQFGVGFYSAFMVAERVGWLLKAGTKQNKLKTNLIGINNRNLKTMETITLYLKKGDKEYCDDIRLRHLVKKYSNHVSYPIKIMNNDNELETINAVDALWTKSPKDITEEEYKSFYITAAVRLIVLI